LASKLIEIIVVIVILAVLMAVAVPSVLSYINEGQTAKYEAVSNTVLLNTQTEYAKAVASDTASANLKDTVAKAVEAKNYGDNTTVDVTDIVVTTKGAGDSEKDIKSVTGCYYN
jgi:type IV pilus assembly protein PilA